MQHVRKTKTDYVFSHSYSGHKKKYIEYILKCIFQNVKLILENLNTNIE